jgi:CRP/FNR family cyclic AMP-dependent transcriptional regulator
VAVDPGLVRQIPLFAGLSPAAVEGVAAAAFVRHYRRNMMVFSAGEPSEAVYFVLRGLVRVFRLTPDGHEQTLHLLRDGEVLAIAAFLEDAPYPASAQTEADSDLLVVRNADFSRLVRSHGELAWAFLVQMSRRLLWAQGRIYDFALRSAAGRVAAALLQLARQHGKPLPEGRYLLDIPLTHRELGHLAGISRETVTRMLHRLRQSGGIRWTEEGYVVVDPRGLSPWLGPDAEGPEG